MATLQITGLDAILHSAGTLWPQRWSRLRRIAESFIRDRLDPNDILVRGAEAFIIAFGTRTGPAVRMAANDLARELNERLAMEEGADRAGGGLDQEHRRLRPCDEHRAGHARTHRAAAGLGDHPCSARSPGGSIRCGTSGARWCRATSPPHHAETACGCAGYQYEDLNDERPDFEDLDVESIRVSERALQLLRDQRKRALVGVSLHISTLDDENGMARILTALDSCDPTLSTYRLLKIAGIESGFPRMHLRSIVGSLRARAPKVVLTAAWHEPDVAGLIQCGATAFGFALSRPCRRRAVGQRQRHAAGAVRRGRGRGACGGRAALCRRRHRPYLAREFRTAGADHICSPVIWARGRPRTPPCAGPRACCHTDFSPEGRGPQPWDSSRSRNAPALSCLGTGGC